MLCQPLTGRTHQLRLHLQLIGCPIANDSCYGGELFYGTMKLEAACGALDQLERMGLQPLTSIPDALTAAYAKYKESASAFVSARAPAGVVTVIPPTDPVPAAAAAAAAAATTATAVAELNASREASPEETAEQSVKRMCRYCLLEGGPAGLELQRSLHCDGIWLHALRYQCQDEWAFTTELPPWAGEGAFPELVHPFLREKGLERERFDAVQARLRGAGMPA